MFLPWHAIIHSTGDDHNTSTQMTPSEIRSVLTIGDACDYELTFQELVRFLAATLQDFIQHMHEVADIDDIA